MPYVITEFGTVLCQTSDGNLAHCQDLTNKQILRYSYDGERLSYHTTKENNFYKLHQTLVILSKHRRYCNIIINGLYLYATADGYISKTPLPMDIGSTFSVVNDDEFLILTKLTTENYFSATENRVLSKNEVHLTSNFNIKLPTFTCDLSSFLSTVSDQGKIISFCYDQWKIEILKPYRPLIYFAAFGSESIFSCLQLSCQSIYNIGGYDGEICIITDKSYSELEEILHFINRDRLHVLRISAEDVLDYTHARFKITELPDIEKFSPILYMDTDIICNRPISEVFVTLFKSQGVACATELAFDINDEFYGRGLFFEDQSVIVPDNRGISSGFFGARSISQIKDLCRCILQSSYSLAAMKNNRRHFTYMDQPFFNYVVRKLGYFDFRLTDHIISLVGNLTGPHDHIERRGFLHFCGGVGNSWPKLTAMKAYLEYLAKNEIP